MHIPIEKITPLPKIMVLHIKCTVVCITIACRIVERDQYPTRGSKCYPDIHSKNTQIFLSVRTLVQFLRLVSASQTWLLHASVYV